MLALQAPHITQMVVDRMCVIRPDIDEPQVVLPMRNLAAMWPSLYPAEQRRVPSSSVPNWSVPPHPGCENGSSPLHSLSTAGSMAVTWALPHVKHRPRFRVRLHSCHALRFLMTDRA